MPRLILACCLSFFIISVATAEKNSEMTPKLLKGPPVVVQDSFDKKTLSDKFATPKGSWKVVDGVLVGKELKSDKHAAVLSYQQPNRNSLIQFSFMLDGTKGFHLSFNHAKGHLFRVIVDTESVAIRTDKDKKDPKSEPLTISQTKSKIAEGEWHTMLVEIIDDQVLVQFDEGPTIIGLHPSLAVDKPNYRFVMRGESLKIDDLKIWAAE